MGCCARRFGLGYDFLQRYPDIIRAISIEQVREAAERHLHPDKLVERLPLRGTRDELDKLSLTINGFLDRIR